MYDLDLLIHPVRLGIIRALTSGALSVEGLKKVLPHTPHATLHRHVKKLLQGGIIEITGQRQRRGLKENIYKLVSDSMMVEKEQFNRLSNEQHMRYFSLYLSTLIADLKNYLEDEDRGPAGDDLAYFQLVFNLSPEDREGFNGELKALLNRYQERNDPRYPKKSFNIISMPVAPASPQGGDTD